MKIVDESILFFFWGFSLKILSGKLSKFRGYMGIYSRVCMECEESVTTKQGVLATQACD